MDFVSEKLQGLQGFAEWLVKSKTKLWVGKLGRSRALPVDLMAGGQSITRLDGP